MSRELLLVGAALGAAVAVLLIWPGHSTLRTATPAREPGVIHGLWIRLRPGAPPPIVELLAALSAELAAGQPTVLALQGAVAGLEPNPCPRALAACRTGADVPAALRADARAPGAAPLRGLAACWEVSDRSGAGLAMAVTRMAVGLRAAAESDAQLEGEIAAVRSSARLLAGLPLLGLLIGQWIGADPLAWLAGSWVGRGVLTAGVTFQLVGMLWLHRMVRSTQAAL